MTEEPRMTATRTARSAAPYRPAAPGRLPTSRSSRPLVDQTPDLADYPHAAEVVQRVLIYDAATLRQATRTGSATGTRWRRELIRAFTDGPGVVGVPRRVRRPVGRRPGQRGVRRDDRASSASAAAAAATTSPRPAPTTGCGTRWRSWRCATRTRSSTTTPTTSSPWWPRRGSGPAYQMTSQVNVVRPGGVAQDPHRDYHLGFLSDEVAAALPRARARCCRRS